MIIWINGAFGSGKTHTAFELNRRLANSFVFDPEEAGFYIRDNIPKEVGESDFQDFNLWRQFNSDMLKMINSKYDGVIICPMTVTNISYFNEIVKDFRDDEFYAFVISASKDTLVKRLRSRFEFGNTWAINKIDHCIEQFEKDDFGIKVESDDLSIAEVAEFIAKECGLQLEVDNRSKVVRIKDKFGVMKNHFRWFK